MRCGRWKLIEFFETGRVELYDTDRDVGEANDLSRARPEKTRELLALLRRWRKSVGAPVPTTPNPRYDPGARPRAPRRNRGERRGGKRGAKGRDRLH